MPVAAFAADSPQAAPPAIYQELSKLLTPMSEVLKKEADYDHQQGDGIVLLDETITYVYEDGRRVSVYHVIEKALNDAGVQSLAQYSFSYKKDFQKAYLVLAQTIQPDGSTDPVKSDAVFLKTPQEDADSSMYNDEVDLVSVYSNVKPGSLIENITVLEDTAPKIPGEFSQTYTWIGGWPEYLQRMAVNLPDSLANRLKITNMGSGVPAPVNASQGSNRQLFTWEKRNTPPEHSDSNEAPPRQAGPLLWLSTLQSWDAFAHWYNGLVQGTEELSPDLKGKIDGWTKNVKDPVSILDILYQHVAQDVRYTAFELGQSDYQPHDCMSVWQRQYGDCKDKSNLLRAMLAYKGIESWLVFLDTEHNGFINKANPDYRQFDHCIALVQIDGKSTFCDPTITYGAPGMLSGAASDREVLVLKGDHAAWARTPPFTGAKLTYSFDLELRPNGELAGWLDMTAAGYYSAFYQSRYRSLTRDQILSSLQDDVRNFFPNSNVADVVPLKPLPSPGKTGTEGAPSFSIRAYMTLTGVLNQADESCELKFPAPYILLPNVSDYKTREHAIYAWTDFDEVTATIRLPAGWKSAGLPSPFNYDSSSASYHAGWTENKGAVTAHCAATIKQGLFSPADWETLGEATTNLEAWADRSLILTKSKDAGIAAPTPQADADLVANLPIMPTGDGELNLIDSEFPVDGNVAARRLALARIPSLFPSDQKAIVEAAIYTAALDLDEQKWGDVISKLEPIEDAYRAALDPDTIAWGDYVIASALAGEQKKDEACALFKKIAEAANTDSGRRGWAIYQVAKSMADSSPAASLDYADRGLDLNSTALPLLYEWYATTALDNKLGDRLEDRLSKLISAKPENLEDILLGIIESARTLIEGGHKSEGLQLVALLESASGDGTLGDSVTRAIKDVRDQADTLTVYAKVQQELKQLVAQYPNIAAMEKRQPQFSSQADARKSASQHEENSEADDSLGCYLRIATGYPADKTFPNEFWDCLNYTEWDMRASPAASTESFFFKLAALAEELPHSSDAYADAKLIEAKVLENKGQREKAAAIYDRLARQTDLADGYAGPLALRSGKNWEALGNDAKALVCYYTAEKLVDTGDNAREALLRAALIQFDYGNEAEAFRLIQLLAMVEKAGKVKVGEQIEDVSILATDNNNLPPFWDNWHAWWPQWQQIEKYAGLDPRKDGTVVPIIPSILDLGSDIGAAKRDNDTKKFFALMRQLAYAARIYPNAAEEFVGMFTTAEAVLPDHANDFRLLAIAILEPLAPNGPAAARTRILNLLVNYVDSVQSGKALELMTRDWKPEIDDGSGMVCAIHRVWSMAAVAQHQDLEKTAAAMEHDLKAGLEVDRAMTVGLLSDVYVALGRPQDAVTLIQTELTNPAVTSDADGQEDLKTRLDNIQNASGESKRLADAVTAWLKDHQPPWWNYAQPKSLDDPRLGRLDDILKNPDADFQPAELVKAGLLAPSVTSLSQDTQEQAVLRAFITILKSYGSQDDANSLANSILDSPGFPDSLKVNFLYQFLLDAYANHQMAAFDEFRKAACYDQMSADSKALMDRIGRFGAVDRTSASAISSYARELAKQPMDSLGLGLMEDAVDELLQLGEIDSAQAIYQDAANFTIASDAGKTKAGFRLELLKAINRAKRTSAVTDAFRQTTLDYYKPASIAKPASLEHRRDLDELNDISSQDATAIRLYLIKMHEQTVGLWFWYDLMRDRKLVPGAFELNLELLQAGLESAADDDVRAAVVDFGPVVLDIDNPSLREKFEKLIQPYRDPVKYPQTMESIRMYDALAALRIGKAVDLDSALSGFSGEFHATRANVLKIRALLQTRNLPRLKNTLNSLSADEMMAPMLLEQVLPALEAVDMKDEAELAREALSKKLYEDVLSVWFTRNGNNLGDVWSDLCGLDSTGDVPPEFTAFVSAHIARQSQLLSYLLLKAYLDKDWKNASALGEKYAQLYPDFYTMDWFLGRSLAELGQTQQAVKALTVYCQYSKDEVWYPEAKALLDKLADPPR